MFRGDKIKVMNRKKSTQALLAAPLLTANESHVDSGKMENNARTLVLVFPSLEEFAIEREAIRKHVIPEIQQFCCGRDIDLECISFFEDSIDYTQFRYLLELAKQPNVTVLCFVGDKYGDSALPLELRTEEYNGIRAAALELSKDVKLLEKHYVIEKTRDKTEYRLRGPFPDVETINRLKEVVQKGVKRAHDDGTIHQINEDRHARFFYSFLEEVVSNLLENSSNHLFATRRFNGYSSAGIPNKWVDTKEFYEKVSALKNRISVKAGEKNSLPFILDMQNTDPAKWFKTKDADKYEQQLITKINERLKDLLNLPAHTISYHYYSASPMELAQREHSTATKFASDISAKFWSSREGLDRKIEELVSKIEQQSESVYFQLYGGTGCGKTVLLTRLYEMLEKKEKFHVLIRYATLTDSSLFANELLRNVFLKVCDLARTNPVGMMGSFHMGSILSNLKTLTETLDKPVIVLIDDIHLLKFGKSLSRLEKPLKKLFPKLSFIFTANSQTPLSCFPGPEFIEIPNLNREQVLDILKKQNQDNLGADQGGTLRQQIKKAGSNIILHEIQYEDLLEGYTEPSPDFDSRLARIENELGAENVKIVCQLLCCLPYGITSLELVDGFRLLKRLPSGSGDESSDFLSPLPYLILRRLGRAIIPVFTDNRKVWIFRHALVAQSFRQRYLPSTVEVRLANETLGDLLGSMPSSEDETDPVASNLVFPHPLNKEHGAVNLRRARFHWYFLLHAGKIEELKMSCLICFDYVEAIFRGCGLARLLSIFEETSQQILDHDILVLFEQILLPSIVTLIRDKDQFVSELINRLRYTRAKNSAHLNGMVEQAMLWADIYNKGPLLVPLTCWISPPKMKQVVSFTIAQWKSSKTVIQPTPNHQHLLIAGNDLAPGQIYMYHIASQLLVKTFSGHTDRVSSISTSHDSLFFASTSYDGTIRLWSFQQADSVKLLKPTSARIYCSLISSDDKWLVTGGADSTARVISLDNGNVLRAFREHTGPVVALQLSSNNELLITGSGDFVVNVYDIVSSQIVVKMSGLMAPVTCLAITSNDAFLAVACEDETLKVFSMVSSQELHELSGHEGRINALAASNDDCHLFAATKGRVTCYDIHNGQLLEFLECANPAAVTSLKITDDNSFVLAACQDRVHIWHMNSMENHGIENNKSTLSCIRMAPDEKGAACGTEDGILAFWDLEICQCLWTTSQQKSGRVTTVDFTADSMHVLSGSAQGTISLWEASNGTLVKTFNVHDDEVRAICCFSDGTRVVSCDKSDVTHIWSLSYLEEMNQVEILSSVSGIRAPMFLRINDSMLIGHSSKSPKEMNIWAIAENKLTVKTKVYHNEEILCCSVNRSGTTLVTGSLDQSLKTWQIDTGFLTQVLVGHEDVVNCCCVSDDGKMVASAGRDKIIVWATATGTILRSIVTKAIVCAVEITQDNTVIVAADESGWIEAYNSETSRLMSSFHTHRKITDLRISSDANRILAKLAGTAQLPILCLHNTPALRSERHQRMNRIQSASSSTSNFSEEQRQEQLQRQEENATTSNEISAAATTTTPVPNPNGSAIAEPSENKTSPKPSVTFSTETKTIPEVETNSSSQPSQPSKPNPIKKSSMCLML